MRTIAVNSRDSEQNFKLESAVFRSYWQIQPDSSSDLEKTQLFWVFSKIPVNWSPMAGGSGVHVGRFYDYRKSRKAREASFPICCFHHPNSQTAFGAYEPMKKADRAKHLVCLCSFYINWKNLSHRHLERRLISYLLCGLLS